MTELAEDMEAAETTDTATTTQESNWYDAISADNLTEEVKNFGGIDALAKGQNDLKAKLGNNIKKPDFTTEQGIADFRVELGIKGTEDYQLPEVSEDLKINKDWWAETAFKNGLSPNQAASTLSDFAMMRQAEIEQAKEAEAKHIGELERELGVKWGLRKEDNIAMAEKAIDVLDVPKESKDWIKGIVGKDPRGMEIFQKIGSAISESSLGGFDVHKTTLSKEDARAEIEAIRNDKTHAFHSDIYSKRKPAIEHMEKLYGIVGEK